MPRPKVSKNLKPGDVVEVKEGETLQSAMHKFFVGCEVPKKIELLDATKPDLLSINNEVRAAIRETRAKLNEIIRIINL